MEYRYDIASNSFKSLDYKKYAEKGKSFFGVSKNFYKNILSLPTEKRNEWLSSRIVNGILGEGDRPFETGLDMQELQETFGYYLTHVADKDEFRAGRELYSRGFGNPFTETHTRYDMATLQNFNGRPYFFGMDVESEKFNAYHRVLNFESLINDFHTTCSRSIQSMGKQSVTDELNKIKEQYRLGYYDLCKQKVFEALSCGELSPDFILLSKHEVISKIIESSGKYEKLAEKENKTLYDSSIDAFQAIIKENKNIFKREKVEDDAGHYLQVLTQGLKKAGGLKTLWAERTAELSVSEKVSLSKELGITPNGNYEPLDTPKYVLSSFANGLECGDVPEQFKQATDDMCKRAVNLQSKVPNVWREYIINKMMENPDNEICAPYPLDECRLSFLYGEMDEDMKDVYSIFKDESTSLMSDCNSLKYDIRCSIKETIPPIEQDNV
mgnify:CR=1 FL=1